MNTIKRLLILGNLQLLLCSYIEIFNSTTNNWTKTYEVHTPAFDLGSREFPVVGEAILIYGCTGMSKMSALESSYISNSNKSILLAKYMASDNGCFRSDYIFECQRTSWCAGVMSQDHSFDPTGLHMWSMFDEHRDRSEYKVPLNQATLDDFNQIEETIINYRKQNISYRITLTSDPNPWTDMFTSIPFLIYFRILTPIWSFGCLFLTVYYFFSDRGNVNSNNITDKNETNKQKMCSLSKWGLKRTCLTLQFITHVSRVVFYAVDPFVSQQIFPYIWTMILSTLITVLDLGTHVLLSFVVRQIVQAKKVINIMQSVRFVLLVVAIIFVLDFAAAIVTGYALNPPFFHVFLVKIFLYVFLNVTLGGWYFFQAYKFFKSSKENQKIVQKSSKARNNLTRITLISSLLMIVLGCFMILLAIPAIYGNPWGYFSFYVVVTFLIQILSFFEIFLFGGVSIDFMSKGLRKSVSSFFIPLFPSASAKRSSDTIDL
eukprot:c21591_g1_i1.p1 GENE.c21591_g1_i1~~c21591_g1_i1.p1  ORF type:complete len:488 (+),score=107.79 c21591_g1_i1:68-1531(+)